MPSTDAPACESCGVRLDGSGRRCPRCAEALARHPLADAALVTALAAGVAMLVIAATFALTDVSDQPNGRGALGHAVTSGDALVTAWRQPGPR